MRGGAGASGRAAEVSEALATGGPEVRGAGAGVRGETARVCLRGRAGATGWAELRGGAGVRGGAGATGWVELRGGAAEVRGGAGVSRGAAMRLPLVSGLPSLGFGG